MWADTIKDFFLTYGLLMLVFFLSFCLALPVAAELQYKHRNIVLTRLAQVFTVLLYTILISSVVLFITAIIS